MIKRLINSAGPIGIDLGEDGARIVQTCYDGGSLRVLASSRVDLRSLGIEYNPEDPAPDALVTAVAKRVSAGGFRGRRCVLSLPAEWLTMRSSRVPVMPEQELINSVELDAPGHLGFEQDDIAAEIGWLKTGEIFQGDDHRMELLYFGAPTDRLEGLSFAFEGAGLEPAAIEPHFVCVTRAMTRFLRRSADSETVQIVIDVCQMHSTILITKGDTLVFCKVVPIGGNMMSEAAEQRLGLDADTVHDLRRHRSADGHPATSDPRIERALFDAVRPTMAQIAREVSLCLRHYSVTFRGARPTACVLVGSEAREEGFASVMSDVLGVETTVGDPLAGISTKQIIGGARYGPAWGGAVGIAVRDLLGRGPSRKRTQRRSRIASSDTKSQGANERSAKGRAA